MFSLACFQQMERFKVVERETKTKAYSKEGLTSGTKLDPAEKERCDIMAWLNDCLEKINIQIDQFEAEIETLGGASKKKRKGGNSDHAEAIEEYNTHLSKHRDHVQKLETLLRMLDNDNVNINQIKDIKEDVEYYIENCQEPDFAENEMIYDDIEGLEEMLLDVSNVRYTIVGHCRCFNFVPPPLFRRIETRAAGREATITPTQWRPRKRCQPILPTRPFPTSTIIPLITTPRGGISHLVKRQR